MAIKVGNSYVSEAAYAYAKERAANKEANGMMNGLAEKFPDVKFSTNTQPFSADGVNNIAIAPNILKEMENDPEKKLEYEALIYDCSQLIKSKSMNPDGNVKSFGFIIDSKGGLSAWSISEGNSGKNVKNKIILDKNKKESWLDKILEGGKKKSAKSRKNNALDTFSKRAGEKDFSGVKMSGKPTVKADQSVSAEKKEEILSLMAAEKDFKAAEFDGELKLWNGKDSRISAEELTKRMNKTGKSAETSEESSESKAVSSEEKEAGEAKNEEDGKPSGKVGFNAEKRARQLSAASSPDQVRIVMNMLNKDLSDCEMGVSNGMCDENEVAKVKAMLQRAEQRMSEVSGNKESEQEKGFDEFAISMLI